MAPVFSIKIPNSPSLSTPSPPFLPSSFHSFSLRLPLPLNSAKPSNLRLLPFPLRIRSIDAAQPYDYESQLQTNHLKSQSLKIAIIGFGNFGQFLAKTLCRQGHTVLAYSRTNYSDAATKLGVTFYSNPHDLCESHPEVVLLCTSILSTEKSMSWYSRF